MAARRMHAMWEHLQARCLGMIARQKALYDDADWRRLKRAGLIIVAAILLGMVGAILQRQPSLFFNALVVASILSQGLIGACRLQEQERVSYFLMVASLLLLLMSFAF